MISLRPNPFDPATLDDICVKARKAFATSGSGAFLRRKLGQSLEYREHRSYVFGDDVRHIDWRASLRHGGPDEFLVRSFEAEEQFQLLVIVDGSATMRAGIEDPHRVSKLEAALWICEALGHIAGNEAIGIGFASLGASSSRDRVSFVQGGQIGEAFAHFSQGLWSSKAPKGSEEVSIGAELSRLKQSSVTIFITDFYRTNSAQTAFEEAIQLASRGYRQAVVCELNSWPTERAILRDDIVSLGAVGAAAERSGAFQASGPDLTAAEDAIQAQRDGYAQALNRGGVVHFAWDFPDRPGFDAMTEGFRLRFHDFLLASELFGRVD
nr:DUF58 domain-containing protein [uncultured Cohaesibacter sp.]